MSRENLSEPEKQMVDEMNLALHQESDNVFVQASVQAILQHLIEANGEEDVQACLNYVISGEYSKE